MAILKKFRMIVNGINFVYFLSHKQLLQQKLEKYSGLFVLIGETDTQFVLVITCFGERFGKNCFSAFLKIFKNALRQFFQIPKIRREIYFKICPKKACDYWLITPNQQTLWIETNIF